MSNTTFKDFMIYSVKNNFALCFIFWFCSFLAATSILEASDLHVILVTDLKAHRIEAGMKKDLERMQKTTKSIAKFTELNLKEKTFTGKKTDPVSLFSHLRNLKVGSDDVVLFYFSGHGFRTDENPENKWPILAFEKAEVGIQFEEIATFLQGKQARLTLIFADCCNHAINSKKHVKPEGRVLLKGALNEFKKGYSKLFLESRGSLVAASAKPGEFSYTNNVEGSLYTIALIKTLKETVKLPFENIKWSTIIEESKSKLTKVTMENNIEQHPIENNAIIEN